MTETDRCRSLERRVVFLICERAGNSTWFHELNWLPNLIAKEMEARGLPKSYSTRILMSKIRIFRALVWVAVAGLLLGPACPSSSCRSDGRNSKHLGLGARPGTLMLMTRKLATNTNTKSRSRRSYSHIYKRNLCYLTLVVTVAAGAGGSFSSLLIISPARWISHFN